MTKSASTKTSAALEIFAQSGRQTSGKTKALIELAQVAAQSLHPKTNKPLKVALLDMDFSRATETAREIISAHPQHSPSLAFDLVSVSSTAEASKQRAALSKSHDVILIDSNGGMSLDEALELSDRAHTVCLCLVGLNSYKANIERLKSISLLCDTFALIAASNINDEQKLEEAHKDAQFYRGDVLSTPLRYHGILPELHSRGLLATQDKTADEGAQLALRDNISSIWGEMSGALFA